MMRKYYLSSILLFFVAAVNAADVPVVKVETPELVAEVNGDKITKNQLANECLLLHGQKELQDFIGKELIEQECKRQHITITAEEINAEIEKTAQTYNHSSQEFLQTIEKFKGVTAQSYRQDIVWRVIALSKLAGQRLTVNEQELNETYESKYGPAVQVRQLVLGTKSEADSTYAELKEKPDTFVQVVKERSIDTTSQAYGGMLQPVHRFTLPLVAEKAIFALKPGEISQPVEMFAGQFVIFKCEKLMPPENVDKKAIRAQLEFKIKESKLHRVSKEVYRDLQNAAKIQIIYGQPAMQVQMPGIAAVVNGVKIEQKELAEACVRKYGKNVLGDMISRRLVAQASQKAGITITDADIDNEIREMALKNLPLKADGSPDTDFWLRRMTEESGQPVGVYRTHTVVPVLSLKRLTRRTAQVTEGDVRRSYEANFGKKVRCLAITFERQDHRRAQEVWEMANKKKTAENFGDLAETYSVDSDTRTARGMIPPIGHYCGAPELEEEAFSLKQGELSQIIETDESLVILYCLGHTEPVDTKLEDVKADIIADVFEKKQNLAVTMFYEKLYEQAVIDNYLTGESKNPRLEESMKQGQQVK